MKAQETRKRRRPDHPLARLDLRIEVSQEEILADLNYPAPARRARRRP
jgi:hypothetical protein